MSDKTDYVEYDYTTKEFQQLTKEYKKLLNKLEELKELPYVEIIGLDRIKDRGYLINLFYQFKNHFILQDNTMMIVDHIDNMYNLDRAYLMFRLRLLAQWKHERASL